MSKTEEGIKRAESSFDTSSSSLPNFQSQVPFNHQFPPKINIENTGKRVGIPPLSPSSQIPISHGNYQQTEGSQNLTLTTASSSHSKTSSQPPFFSLDSLPPLSPYRESDHDNLPPHKTHKRSNSDIPFGFSTILQSSPPLIPSRGSSKGFEVKRESTCEKNGGEVVDDFFSTYINLNNLGRLNTFRESEDLDSKTSNTKTNGGDISDNEATSSSNIQKLGVGLISDKREGIKRSAGGDIAPTNRHYRSVSMDSIMGKIDFANESLVPGGQIGKLSPSDSIDPNSESFRLEFGNGMFSGTELKKIMTNENLAEIALTDPKRVKRILANRQSAARSKERKMRYITELENKVQTLQTETTTLSAQLSLLQRDSASLTSQNNELKFRLQSMEQQAHLRDALNEALTGEVQRMKMMTVEQNGDAAKFSQLSLDPRMYQLHCEQSQQQNGILTTHE